jgi:lipopolysaccharide export system protein LptA
MGDAVLVGQVTIVDDTDNTNADGYELTVSLENAQVVVPEGMTVVFSNDMTEAYTRLVEVFADGVVSRLK